MPACPRSEPVLGDRERLPIDVSLLDMPATAISPHCFARAPSADRAGDATGAACRRSSAFCDFFAGASGCGDTWRRIRFPFAVLSCTNGTDVSAQAPSSAPDCVVSGNCALSMTREEDDSAADIWGESVGCNRGEPTTVAPSCGLEDSFPPATRCACLTAAFAPS